MYKTVVFIYTGDGGANSDDSVKDSCDGDSGGPAAREMLLDSETKWVQAGVYIPNCKQRHVA